MSEGCGVTLEFQSFNKKNMNSTIALAHESKLSEKLNDVMYLLECADEERVRGQAYMLSTLRKK